MGLLTLRVLTVYFWFYNINMTQWTPERDMGTLEY